MAQITEKMELYLTEKVDSKKGFDFKNAIEKSKKIKNTKIVYGTRTHKWHIIDNSDRDYDTTFAIEPDIAEKLGEIKSIHLSIQNLTNF